MNDEEITALVTQNEALKNQNEQFRTALSEKDSRCTALTGELDEAKRLLADSTQIAERLKSKMEATQRDLREVFSGINQAVLAMLAKYQD